MTNDFTNTLLQLERGFWVGGSDFYRKHLAETGQMVFGSEIGRLNHDDIMAGIEAGARWSEVSMDHIDAKKIDDKTTLISYEVSAKRDGEDSAYTAFASSVYHRHIEGWKLVFHQQTPSPG